MTQGIEECFLRSLELARVPCQRPDEFHPLCDQPGGDLELFVEPVLPRGGGLELLVESILVSGDPLQNRLDPLKALSDFRLHEAEYTSRQERALTA